MREIRTYGLMRGCWSARLARRTGVYSTRFSDVTVARRWKQVECSRDSGLRWRLDDLCVRERVPNAMGEVGALRRRREERLDDGPRHGEIAVDRPATEANSQRRIGRVGHARDPGGVDGDRGWCGVPTPPSHLRSGGCRRKLSSMARSRRLWSTYSRPMISRTQPRTTGNVGRGPSVLRARSICRKVNATAVSTT